MIFWIVFLMLIIGIGLIVWYNCSDVYDEWKFFVGMMLTCVSAIVLFVLEICMILDYSGAEAKQAELQETYEAITYKIESGVCRDEFGLLNKEVVDEVQNWNVELRKNKKLQRNFWIGIFYPNIYDDLDYIEYSKYKSE